MIDQSNNKNVNSTVTAQPLAGGQQTPAQQTQTEDKSTQTSQTPATFQTGMSSTQAGAQQQPTQQKSKGPASSGMFTNIQKYVQKNQPQAQQMATAVTTNIQNTANAVKTQNEELQKKFQNQAVQSGVQNVENAVQDVTAAANIAAGYNQQPENTATDSTIQSQENEAQPNFNDLEQQAQQDRRVQDLLNMTYQGPTDIRTLYGFADLANKAREAQQMMDTAISGDRRQVLKQTFGGNNSGYTKGMYGLDDIILGNNISQIQEDVQQMGPATDIIEEARTQASDYASDRSEFINKQREAARSGLLGVAEQRRQEIDDRLSTVVENWDALPEYYRDVFRQSAKGGNVELSSQEAEMLGLKGSGLGIYNIAGNENALQNLFKATSADRSKLIEKDEFNQLSRLQALTKMARDDLGKNIAREYAESLKNKGGFDLTEGKGDLAGTQTFQDALDVQNFQDQMKAEEQRFRDMASKNIVGTGKGSAKYNKGWLQGRATVNKTATQSANLKNILSKQGYDFNRDLTEMFTDPSQVKGYTDQDIKDVAEVGGGKASFTPEGELAEAITSGKIVSDVGQGVGSLTNDVLGFAGLQNLGVGNVIGNIGNEIASGINNITGNIFGSGKSEAKKKALNEARKAALTDLQKKVKSTYATSGFENRLNIRDSEALNDRFKNLQDLIKRYS